MVSRTSSGKFLHVGSCYTESFGFLRLCIIHTIDLIQHPDPSPITMVRSSSSLTSLFKSSQIRQWLKCALVSLCNTREFGRGTMSTFSAGCLLFFVCCCFYYYCFFCCFSFAFCCFLLLFRRTMSTLSACFVIFFCY